MRITGWTGKASGFPKPQAVIPALSIFSRMPRWNHIQSVAFLKIAVSLIGPSKGERTAQACAKPDYNTSHQAVSLCGHRLASYLAFRNATNPIRI